MYHLDVLFSCASYMSHLDVLLECPSKFSLDDFCADISSVAKLSHAILERGFSQQIRISDSISSGEKGRELSKVAI